MTRKVKEAHISFGDYEIEYKKGEYKLNRKPMISIYMALHFPNIHKHTYRFWKLLDWIICPFTKNHIRLRSRKGGGWLCVNCGRQRDV